LEFGLAASANIRAMVYEIIDGDEVWILSRTVRDMLFGATIATAGLWVLAATIMLLRK
jgi:hypothetical protein